MAALRSLATGMWRRPAASALLRRPGPGMPLPMPAAARPRFIRTFRDQVEQRSNRTRKKETADEDFALRMKEIKELAKVYEVLSQHPKELQKLNSEVDRVAKICAVSFAGIAAFSVFWRWTHEEPTQN